MKTEMTASRNDVIEYLNKLKLKKKNHDSLLSNQISLELSTLFQYIINISIL